MDTPNMAQKVIAQAVVEGGGDLIIGNHPHQSQDFIALDGVPVFYALGHSVTDPTVGNYYNYIVEVEFSEQIDHIKLRVGKLVDGTLDFALSPEDREYIQATLAEKESLFERFEIVY